MIRYDRLLVPVDGSDAADAAARTALGLAERTGAAVDVVHVVESSRDGATAGGDGSAGTHASRGAEPLESVRRMAKRTDVALTTELLEGRPYESIVAYADEHDVHLVVMGRQGVGTVGTRLLGGVAEKVLRAGSVPVLTVRADEGEDAGVVDAERVLLPTDGSDCAALATDHAVAIADLAGATVHVVSVADLDAAGGLFDAGGVSEEFVANVESRCEEAASRLAAAVQSATGNPAETAVRRGNPSSALAGYVEENDVDVVVMGAHGRSGVAWWMLGSVTEKLLRTVDVPVLVVPGSR